VVLGGKVILLDRVLPAIEEIAVASPEQVLESVETGANHYLIKPYDRVLDFFALPVWRFMIVQARMSQRHP